jgi:alkylation response protein AidB-like acyl-CoA dehydrogenase
MGFLVTNRAFRFDVNGTKYALDCFADGIVFDGPAVHLLYQTAGGEWNRAHVEMEPVLFVRQADIDAAGGIVKLCEIIVAKVNRALRLLHGAGDDADVPPGTLPHERVADYLREHLALRSVNGVPELYIESAP